MKALANSLGLFKNIREKFANKIRNTDKEKENKINTRTY